MSGTTSVPTPAFGPNGFIAPIERDILTGVNADLNSAFGGNLNLTTSVGGLTNPTPQAQIASSGTAIIGDCNDQFLAVTQGVDPKYAQGRMQDGIARIYFIERNPVLPTTVSATCTGLVGAVIPVGALAQATDGNLYACQQAGIIAINGMTTLPFACTVAGPISCPAGSLATIYRSVPGWDTVTNASDGVLGNDVETRAAFEARRTASVAQNGRNTLGAIQGAVLNVPAILDAYTTQNSTGSPVTLDGVTLPAHSLYVCVAGGDPAAVAAAIFSKLPPGCDMAGNTTQTVTDNNSAYSPPVPTYSITFQTAVSQEFVFKVQIANTPAVPSDAATQIQNVILPAFAGADGGPRARIGSTVYAGRFYSGVAALGTWAQIVAITIGSTASLAAIFTAAISGTLMTVSAVSAGTLAVGQSIIGTGVTDGTFIASLGSGSGSTGTYNLNQTQTVISEGMVSFPPELNDIAVGVAHVPTLSAGNIIVKLV